jgi:hypothetical protein
MSCKKERTNGEKKYRGRLSRDPTRGLTVIMLDLGDLLLVLPLHPLHSELEIMYRGLVVVEDVPGPEAVVLRRVLDRLGDELGHAVRQVLGVLVYLGGRGSGFRGWQFVLTRWTHFAALWRNVDHGVTGARVPGVGSARRHHLGEAGRLVRERLPCFAWLSRDRQLMPRKNLFVSAPFYC